MQKVRSRMLYIAAAASWAAALLIMLCRHSYHTATGLDIASVFMLTVLVKLLGQIPLNILSYLTLFPIMIVEKFAFSKVSYSFFFLFFIADLCILLFLQTGNVRGYFAELSVAALAAEAVLLGYDFLSTKLLSVYFDLGHALSLTPVEKMLLIITFSIVFITASALCAKTIGWLLRRKYDLFELMSKKFSGLEAYLFGFVTLTLVFLRILIMMSYFRFYYTLYLQIFFILTDAAYIGLLLKAVSIKEKMTIAENERNTVSAYSAKLETTLENMRDVRHDVKNLFLTMGNFVEESNDSRMKEFYSENIVPFMQDAIMKNELHDKLKLLYDDEMKSFFYLKITEMMCCGISVNIEILSPMSIRSSFGDAIRLFGILLDNAAEEAAVTPEKLVSIKISSEENGEIIRIGNTVRRETRARGIIPGTTDKGPERGRGLIIADRIISKYNNLILNSYFTETEFVQLINILR